MHEQQSSLSEAEIWKKENESLKKDKMAYAAEKRVLLDLLTTQCDEIDKTEKAINELERFVSEYD